MLLHFAALAAHVGFAVWCLARLTPQIPLPQRVGATAVLAGGTASASGFWQLQVCGAWSPSWQVVELGLWLPWLSARRPARAPQAPGCDRPAGWLWGLVALAAAQVVLHWWATPTGSYDATANWNLRARAVVAAPQRWAELFANQPGIPHPDYPMGLPLLVARAWLACGGLQPLVPLLLGVAAAALCVLVVWSAVCTWRGATAGALAAALLLAAPELWRQSVAQGADVPVALAFTVTAVLGCHALHTSALRGWLVCGLALGAATWIKNEALLFALLFGGSVCVAIWRRDGLRRALRAGATLTLGALPFVLTLAAHKRLVPQSNELLPFGRLHDAWLACFDPHRWWVVIVEIGRRALGHGHFACLVALALTPWLRGAPALRGSGVLAGVLIGMLLGHAGVALITPYDQAFHIATTQTRLLLQLWPLTVLALGGWWGAPAPALEKRPA